MLIYVRCHETRRLLSVAANVTIEGAGLDCCFVRKAEVMPLCTTVARETEDKCHAFTIASHQKYAMAIRLRNSGHLMGSRITIRGLQHDPKYLRLSHRCHDTAMDNSVIEQERRSVIAAW